jgi:tyrosyl-tRNA synthetase
MQINFLKLLKERGLVAQVSHETELETMLEPTQFAGGKIPAVYLGIDPTAKSLTIGHLVPLLALRRAQDCGLSPVVLFGGATGLVGDPTGRTEMRQMLNKETIQEYIENFKKLVTPLFRFDVPNKPIFVNNIDWIGPLSWIEFAREIGTHFTVARLLAAEVNKTRYEQGGLTFLELGYQLLQAYDFLQLYRSHNCILQMGGNDQWSNVLAGADLIRRMDSGKAFALTLPLLTSSDGQKIGKTAGNALWLDPAFTSPYEFYQYFRSCADADLALLFRIFTFFSMDEINAFLNPKVTPINEAKEILAFEVTKTVHGETHALHSREAARALFSGQGDLSGAPHTELDANELQEIGDILNLLIKTKLCGSRGEARKLIQGNGLTINSQKITDPNLKVDLEYLTSQEGQLTIRKGKKDFHIVSLKM